jgi:N-acylneuraminate cytidylyltransferase
MARLLAVIPARGGSKGLPGKNIRPFLGLPLIAHTILFARLCPEIDRCVVSTDSPEIADVARQFSADVPFMRPAELAQDDTPMWPVVRHALQAMEDLDGIKYEYLLLLDPTSPGRLPADVAAALQRLQDFPSANGIIAVSQPEFNPLWHCVVERDGWMTDLIEEGGRFERRQDVPVVYRINGLLYIWRTDFVWKQESTWRRHGRDLIYVIPEFRALSINNGHEFERAELLVKSGIIAFSWLTA